MVGATLRYFPSASNTKITSFIAAKSARSSVSESRSLFWVSLRSVVSAMEPTMRTGFPSSSRKRRALSSTVE